MKDRDCESCKKFSRVDPYESEGYCDAKRIWVDPQEGEDCKIHEFTLHSATKYKDGTPIMSEPEVDINSSYPESIVNPKSNQLDALEQRVDELSEEYDAVLKTHGDTLEEHREQIEINERSIDNLDYRVDLIEKKILQWLDRICDLEHLYENILDDLFAMRDRLCKITDLLVGQNEFSHIFSNFCGNCTHATVKDGICACELSGEIVDPDSASCSMFEPPF